MKNTTKPLRLAVYLTCLLAVTACGESQIYSTATPIPGGQVKGIGNDWRAVCIDGVKYIFKNAGVYGGALAPYFKQDGTLHTCDS